MRNEKWTGTGYTGTLQFLARLVTYTYLCVVVIFFTVPGVHVCSCTSKGGYLVL
jgi:hypothetical protein